MLKQLNPQEENKSKRRPENYKLGQGGLTKRGHFNKSCSEWEERLLKFSSDHMGLLLPCSNIANNKRGKKKLMKVSVSNHGRD